MEAIEKVFKETGWNGELAPSFDIHIKEAIISDTITEGGTDYFEDMGIDGCFIQVFPLQFTGR